MSSQSYPRLALNSHIPPHQRFLPPLHRTPPLRYIRTVSIDLLTVITSFAMAEHTPSPDQESNEPSPNAEEVVKTTEAADTPDDKSDSSPVPTTRKRTPISDEDDPPADDDAGGLFGSGSEDEDGG